MTQRIQSQKGFVVIATATLVIALLVGFTGSVVALYVSQNKVARNIMRAQQSLYASESGIEDAMLRLKKNLQLPSSYAMTVDGATATVAVSDLPGASRTITVEGNSQNRMRTMSAAAQISADAVALYYGAHIGARGLRMENLSKIIGNVFSNGNIDGDSGAEITGTAQVAGAGGKIEDVKIGGDAYADACEEATIVGTLYGNVQSGCTYASFVPQGAPLDPVALPIAESQITEWKLEAEAGGVIQGDYLLSGSSHSSLGPKKIVGNLTVEMSAQLSLTGTLWVTGNVLVKNNANVRLSGGYGNNSGILVSDGTVTLQNNSVSAGSGQTGSYLMYLSTSSSDSAITVKNLTRADILYAANGSVQVVNNIYVREITGLGVTIKNNTQIQYESGLSQTAFISGPGGAWTVSNWKEVE
ncbi:MAG: hypothetical protein HYV78_01170 [Candidatus Wildermuthbacteria bacterium]|nr:hypothetical protein [Candidatus Wildermuthbacteria bacterium]